MVRMAWLCKYTHHTNRIQTVIQTVVKRTTNYTNHTNYGIGNCPGRISTVEGEGNGFGFDPIFIPDELDEEGNYLPHGQRGITSTDGITFGGIDMSVKQKFSHRRRALDALLEAIDTPSAWKRSDVWAMRVGQGFQTFPIDFGHYWPTWFLSYAG